jgi:dGTPase
MRSVYASNPTISIGRLFKEKPTSLRNEYQRDRDRIIHCSALDDWNIKHKYL